MYHIIVLHVCMKFIDSSFNFFYKKKIFSLLLLQAYIFSSKNKRIMRNTISLICLFISLCLISFTADAQINLCDADGTNPLTGKPCVNAIITSVPFLRITPDARSAGMGDAGIATSPDANAIHFNSSKLAFAEHSSGFSANYTPLLRALGLEDVHLFYLTNYVRLNRQQTLGIGLRYFDRGKYRLDDYQVSADFSPKEYELALSYNRKFNERFAAGLTLKYIYSRLVGRDPYDLIPIDAQAIASDLSFTYKTPLTHKLDLTVGSVISNLGTKMNYEEPQPGGGFLPSNLGIGGGLTWEINEVQSLHFALDINRLLLPTPPDDAPNFDYLEKSVLAAALGSFTDAPGGFAEEMRENTYSLGLEYRYKRLAARIGHFNEHWTKGNRKYMTLGMELNLNFATLNVSYLPASSKGRSPLDNTFRCSLLLNFTQLDKDRSAE